jgi:hypothetical protein
LNQLNNEHDDGNHEQKMDQTAAKVADKAQKPEHDQDNNYSPEHGLFLSVELNFRRPFIQKFIYSPSSFRTSSRTVLLGFRKAGEFKRAVVEACSHWARAVKHDSALAEPWHPCRLINSETPRVLVAVIFSLALIIAVWMWHDIEKQKFNADENRFQIHSTTERHLPVVLILDTRTGEV